MYEPVLTPEGWLRSLGWASDACIEFQGFASELQMCIEVPLSFADQTSEGDPALNVAFPHSHGLVHIHSLPTLHTLLPPAQKHSSLLGVGPGSTGQNNLAFKLKRKRLIIETLHLGVEGGVGERRTEPTSTGGALDVRKIKREAGHDHSHSHDHTHDHAHHAEGIDKPVGDASVRFAAVNISMDDSESARTSTGGDDTQPLKKERKKVSFIRHDKPELYDF
jgi:elongator complex protein 4